MKRIIIAAIALALATPAMGQQPKIGGPVGQALDRIQGQQGSNEAQLGGGGQVGGICDSNVIGSFQAKNLLAQIKTCLALKGAIDAQAALDSATKANDTVAQTCLKPVVALLQAAEGTTTPGATPDAPSTVTPAGPLLIFQKFREFALAGGVPNCRSWVNTTLAAGAPIQ
jgi:hypothetical protein